MFSFSIRKNPQLRACTGVAALALARGGEGKGDTNVAPAWPRGAAWLPAGGLSLPWSKQELS